MRPGKHVLFSEWIVITVFLVMVVSTFLQILSRYVLGISLPWADELARHCLMWLVFIGMVIALVRGHHVTVDVLLDWYGVRARLWALTFIDLAGALLFGVLLYGGVLLMQMTATQSTSGMGIPKPFVYAALPLGAALMLIEFAIRIWQRFRARVA